MRRTLLFALVLLAACGLPQSRTASDAEPPPRELRRFVSGLVFIKVSEALPTGCADAIQAGADWWVKQGSHHRFVIQSVPADHMAVNGGMTIGEVGVVPEPPTMPNSAAETHMGWRGDLIMLAEIRFRPDMCTIWHAAHELGHVQGLLDSQNKAHTMYFSNQYRNFGASRAELLHVAL